MPIQTPANCMKNRVVARLIAAAILGLLFGCYFHSKETQYAQAGRREFLAKQGLRYDQRIAKQHSLAFDVSCFLFLVGGFLGSYEILTVGLLRILWNERS